MHIKRSRFFLIQKNITLQFLFSSFHFVQNLTFCLIVFKKKPWLDVNIIIIESSKGMDMEKWKIALRVLEVNPLFFLRSLFHVEKAGREHLTDVSYRAGTARGVSFAVCVCIPQLWVSRYQIKEQWRREIEYVFQRLVNHRRGFEPRCT